MNYYRTQINNLNSSLIALIADARRLQAENLKIKAQLVRSRQALKKLRGKK